MKLWSIVELLVAIFVFLPIIIIIHELGFKIIRYGKSQFSNAEKETKDG